MLLLRAMSTYDRLVADGMITPATLRVDQLPLPVRLGPGAMTISEALLEQRGERLERPNSPHESAV